MNTMTTTFSFLFLVAGIIFFVKNVRRSASSLSVLSVFVVCSVVMYICYVASDYFTDEGINEAVIYHVLYGLGGTGWGDFTAIIIAILVLLLTALTSYVYFLKKYYKNFKTTSTAFLFLSIFFLVFSLLMNPVTVDLAKIYKRRISTPALSEKSSYYRQPYAKAITKKHKNFVLIYAESLERTYFDASVFPNLITELKKLESEFANYTFMNIKPSKASGWTIGGMVASQCGIPLVTTSAGNTMSGVDKYLPSAVCIGDLLQRKGYNLNYLGGASLDFAGKGKFYSTHGFSSVQGREELLPELKEQEYRSWWGLFDDSLFDLVYERFLELSKSKQKFGIVTLTLDTHHPKGNPSKNCKKIQYNDGKNPMLNAVSCSDYLIGKLIRKIMRSPFGKDTVVVLVSDHLAMRNSAYEKLKSAKERKMLFTIFDNDMDVRKKITTRGYTTDIGVTLLPFLGYEGEIGFGRNLLNNMEPESERVFIQNNLHKWRTDILTFWDFPKIHKKVSINVKKQTVQLDERTFKFPILIETNDNLETTLKFGFYVFGNQEKLVEHVENLAAGQHFLLIDFCKEIQNLSKKQSSSQFCFIAGERGKYSSYTELNNDIIYSKDQIKKILNL